MIFAILLMLFVTLAFSAAMYALCRNDEDKMWSLIFWIICTCSALSICYLSINFVLKVLIPWLTN